MTDSKEIMDHLESIRKSWEALKKKGVEFTEHFLNDLGVTSKKDDPKPAPPPEAPMPKNGMRYDLKDYVLAGMQGNGQYYPSQIVLWAKEIKAIVDAERLKS
jgi:hypothetical protein